MAKLYKPLLGSNKTGLSQDTLNALAAYQNRNAQNLPSNTAVKSTTPQLSVQLPVSEASGYKGAVKPIFNPSMVRNAPAPTKITPEQQAANKQVLLGEIQKSKLAGAVPGAVSGSPLFFNGLIPVKYDPAVQEALNQQKVTFKSGSSPRLALHYQQTSDKPTTETNTSVNQLSRDISSMFSLPGEATLAKLGLITLKSGKKVASIADFDMLPSAEKQEVMSELERLAYESNVRKGKVTPQGDTVYGNSFNQAVGELPAPVDAKQYVNNMTGREVPRTITPNERIGTSAPRETPVLGANLTPEPRNQNFGIGVPPVTKQAENLQNELSGMQKDLGADINKLTDDNAAKFGTFPNSNVPKATGFGDVQKHANTLYKSSLADENMKERILEAVNEGDFTKYTKHNETALKNADYEMKQGLESARTKFDSVSTSAKTPTSDDLALGYKLMKEYQESGRYEDALTVAEDLSQMLSETGRTLQAARMANLLTPDGRVRMLGKAVNRMKKSSGQDIKLSNDTLEAVRNAKSEKEIAEANKKAFVEIWNQVPRKWSEKLNAWRYMSMLFNPKTHIRNIVGNLIFVPVRTLKNTIGTGLESAIIKKGEKTKAVLTAKDKDLIDFAKSDYPNVEGMLKNETKFSDTLRDHDAKVFESKILEGIRRANGGALDKEDLFFLSRAYSSSMAQYMKANGLKAADMQGVKLDKARKYAMNEAAKATYRDTSEFATKLNRTKRELTQSDNGFKKAMGIMLEGTVPFTKTPVNILKRGFEYSPVGLLNGMVKLRKALAKGENPVEALDNLAAGMSGTAIMGLGAWLNRMGVLQGSSEDPYGTKKNAYETMQGQQEYSLNFGDKSYTVDWAAPVSMPLFVGAELYKALSGGGMGFSEIADGILSIAEPMLNLSMLQGINEAVKTGFNDNAMFSVAETALSGYVSQFVPTLGGQISRSVDQTRRSTASTAESVTQRQLEKFGNKQIAKVPGASIKLLQPSVDLWGREQKNASVIENFLSPGYFKSANVTPVDKEINALTANLDEETAKKIIPRATKSYDITEDNVKYRMTEKELTQFQKTRGQYSYKELDRLFKNPVYQGMSDAQKVRQIAKIYGTAFDMAKAEMLNGRTKE